MEKQDQKTETHSLKYILTPPAHTTATLYYTEWITCWNKNLQKSTMFFIFKNYSLVEVIYLRIRFNKTQSFLWNTKITDRNGIDAQNTHTREKDNFRESFS